MTMSTMRVAGIAFVAVLAAAVSAHGHGHHHGHHHHRDHDDHDHDHVRWHGVRGLAAGHERPIVPPGPWSTWHEFEMSGARCKTPDPTEAERAASDHLVQKYMHMKAKEKNGRVLFTGDINVKTYFHILDKRITEPMIDGQKATLMNSFISTGTNFRFDIEVIRYPDTDPYMTDAGSAGYTQSNAINLQTAHRRGDKDTLNVFLTELTSGLLGWATLPSSSSGGNSDGVMNQWSTMNGGPLAPYDGGMTLAHETGHWLGLYHTFEGGCTGFGDYVADTPFEAEPAYGCPTGKDTCVGGGPDPITNIMDYTDDSCMNQLTPDQNDRMVAHWFAFRSIVPPPSPDPNCVDDPPNWYDSYGDGCDWYVTGNNCAVFGSDFESPDFGTTAIEACCICGGGSTTTPPSPTNPPPTNPPAPNPCDSSPCQNGGQCTSSGSGYTCLCAGTGFTGTNCETNIDDCTPTSCANGGACIDGVNGFICECAGTGFTGPTCQTNIDDCTPTSCANGGSCIDGVNGFTCNCAGTGFSGPTCQTNIDDCTPTSCANGGSCIDGVNGFTCNCAGTGFSGPTCQTNIDDCTPTSCANGGACIDGVNGSTCNCAGTGFTGPTCQTNIDDCTPTSCANGGACIDGVNGSTCNCAGTGFTGPTCQTNIDDCTPTSCANGGACIDGVNGSTCNCAGTGFTGPTCQTNIDDCTPTSCANGGACIDGVNGSTCNCAGTGFTGPTCQTNIDDCTPTSCANGGACIDGVNGSTCNCAGTGFTGPTCQTNIDDCTPTSCANGGACIDGVNGSTCNCAGTGFTGPTCQNPTPTAPPTPTPQPTNPQPAPPTFPPGQKGAVLETWHNVPSNDENDRVMLDSLKRLSSYPDSPDEVITLQNSILETPNDRGSDFGSKLWTYFVAPVTGQCHFYIASDDNGELRLSANANPLEAVLIASVVGSGADGWTPPRQWSKYGTQKSGAIDLVQGEVRYLEAIMKEGGGGDNLAIGWECPGLAGRSLDVISTEYTVLEPPNGPAPPTPTPQPTNPQPAPPTFPPGQKGAVLETWHNVPSNDENDRVMLDSLKRLSSYPDSPDEVITLQNSILETPNDRGSDFGSKLWTYFVAPVTGQCHFYIASDDNGELRLSANANPLEAVLIASVVGSGADGWTPPRQWSKYGTQKSGAIDLVQGEVRYLEAIMKEGGGGDNLAIGWECPGLAGRSLDVISTEYTVLEPPNGPAPPTPTPQPTNPQPAPPTFPPGQKGAVLETWHNVPSNDENDRVMLDSLKRLSSYPDSPDEVITLQNSILETPNDRGSDFGSKLWTYFVAPVTGQCHFYIASDDNGELRLSANANPLEAVLIASVVGSGADGWTPPRQWSKYGTQKSGAIDLVQGEVRYLEAIMKEGGGGDNLAIGWECPGLAGRSLDVISTEYTVLEPPNGPAPPTPTPQPTNPQPAPPTFPPGQKGAVLETWRNVPSNDENDRVMLDSLKRLSSYPDSPDEVITLQNSILETPNDRGSDFGSKLWTYFVAPVTGQCHFYIASDDNGELRLSANANPLEAVLIASVVGSGADGWTPPRQWSKYGTQKSGAIDLVQGEVRYLEAIMKEGGGGDNLAIGWECPGLAGRSLDVISTEYTVLEPPAPRIPVRTSLKVRTKGKGGGKGIVQEKQRR